MELKVVYSAPNRGHHYAYARQLRDAGILKAFVCGFPRISPRAPMEDLGSLLVRSDFLQTVYVASLKARFPVNISDELAHWAKMKLDHSAWSHLKGANVFLYYNGAGLKSARRFHQEGGINIVEAVNSHVLDQEQLLADEHKRVGLPWRPFHLPDVKRRVAEVEEADYILLPSKFVAKSFLARGFPEERLLRVPFPMHVKPRGDEQPEKDDVFRVLYVGSISLRKGLRYLIEAFGELKHPKKELWIAGPKAEPTGLEDVSIPEGVKFLGVLKGGDLHRAYSSATVFCLPSIEEGLALVLIEALSHRLPIIATENSGVEDLLTDGEGAMVVPIRDSDAIQNWLSALAQDSELLARKKAEAVEACNRICDASFPTLPAKLLSNVHSQFSEAHAPA